MLISNLKLILSPRCVIRVRSRDSPRVRVRSIDRFLWFVRSLLSDRSLATDFIFEIPTGAELSRFSPRDTVLRTCPPNIDAADETEAGTADPPTTPPPALFFFAICLKKFIAFPGVTSSSCMFVGSCLDRDGRKTEALTIWSRPKLDPSSFKKVKIKQ